jgi:hypothetical protein
MTSLVSKIKTCNDLLRENEVRYQQRRAGDGKKVLAEIHNTNSSAEAQEAERRALTQFVQLCAQLRDEVELLATWARQAEAARYELIDHYARGHQKTSVIIDREKFLATLDARLKAFEVE